MAASGLRHRPLVIDNGLQFEDAGDVALRRSEDAVAVEASATTDVVDRDLDRQWSVAVHHLRLEDGVTRRRSVVVDALLVLSDVGAA